MIHQPEGISIGAGRSFEALLAAPDFGLAAVLLLPDMLLLCFWLGTEGPLDELALSLAGALFATGTALPEASSVINWSSSSACASHYRLGVRNLVHVHCKHKASAAAMCMGKQSDMVILQHALIWRDSCQQQ